MFARKCKVEEEIDDGPPFRESMKIGCGYIMQYLNKWDTSSCSYCQENHSSSSYNSRRCKKQMKVNICVGIQDDSSSMNQYESKRQIASWEGAL